MVMNAYGIVVLPLIKKLKREITDITQHSYADDSKTLGLFTRIETYFNLIIRQGLG